MEKHLQARRWVIWGLAVAFYFYEYFLRVAPSVMVHDLFKAFNIGAGVFGIISAAYLYAYAPMQLPVGMLMDRFGARKLLTFATLICGISSLLFGISPGTGLAIFARLLMGAGSAFAFIGMVYVCSHWFHGKILALLIGIGNSIGMLGAVFGEGPLAELVELFSWRSTSIALGVLGLILGGIIYIAVRNDPPGAKSHPPKSSEPLLLGLKTACKNSQTWINGVIAMMFYTATVAYGGLWAIPFLRQARGFSNESASFAASMVYVGWIVGGPIIGHFSDKWCNRKGFLFTFILLSIALFSWITYGPPLSEVWTFVLIFLLGVALSGQLLCYALAIELNTSEVKGAALALTNFLVFVAGSAVATLVGFLLDLNWTGKIVGGIHYYELTDFQIALTAFPVTMAIAFLFTFFIKEKEKPWAS